MYIENARIDDVTIVPTSDVTIVPTRYGMELEITLELQDGDRYTYTFNMVTPIEDIATLCDVVGVQSYGELIGARIRVWAPDYENIQIIGNATDNNKWLHLKQFNRMILHSSIGLLYTGDEKDRKSITRKVIRMKDLNKVIERPYRMTEIRKRFDKLDLVEIDTYLDQGEYFLSKETDEDCRQYIFNTIAREIAEIAYIEPPEYTPEKAKHFRDTMTKHLLLALQYNEY